jgi:hypothetical protein
MNNFLTPFGQIVFFILGIYGLFDLILKMIRFFEEDKIAKEMKDE